MSSIEQQIIDCCRYGDSTSPFAIYANNRMVALRMALEKNFPTLITLFGAKELRPLLREYCHRFPPESPYLVHYGEKLACMLRQQKCFYEAEVAELDYAWLSVLMAEDVHAVGACDIGSIEDLAKLRLHPAIKVVACQPSNLKLWLTFGEKGNGEKLTCDMESAVVDVLFYRNDTQQVNLMQLSAAESLFIECLKQGLTVEQSSERVGVDFPMFSLSDWFGRLLMFGGLCYE
ncbi:DNA-binding domain-containing protein [Idiomarina loihiensis]|uniref:HvfC/BufC N-terminal domain-containing protein n=1 Tax=Idiomarina loihiensis TaxID=135577 RepID=UPI000C10D5D3|nr:MAG: hypothetical protein COA80_11395 [Leeuwenhoekiella sp.]